MVVIHLLQILFLLVAEVVAVAVVLVQVVALGVALIMAAQAPLADQVRLAKATMVDHLLLTPIMLAVAVVGLVRLVQIMPLELLVLVEMVLHHLLLVQV
jgi:hypothetical protein